MAPTSWSKARVDKSVAYWATSLALDPESNVHIAYHDYCSGGLKYATQSGGRWTVESLDSDDMTGGFVSLAIDSKANPHISYSFAFDGAHISHLKYARKGDGVWTVETVDGLSSVSRRLYVHVGWFTSLALDPEDNPHIAYYDSSVIDYSEHVSNLKYANRSRGTWTVETVDSHGDVGKYASLALDAKANPQICYNHTYGQGRGSQLKYASKSGGKWTSADIATPGSDEWDRYYTSLALDAQGNPHIVYSEMTEWMKEGTLKYAIRSGRDWTFETVDSVGNGGDASLALDAKGLPCIAYYKSVAHYGPGELKYAIKSGSNWTSETVDSGRQIGSCPSLALDAYGNPHIAYCDLDTSYVKYAQRQ